MFAILQYVVKQVIKPIIFSPVDSSPALTWQAVCTEIVVRGFKCYRTSMKWIRSPSTELYGTFSCIHYVPVWFRSL